ncbi:hypothetical protein DM860_016419 [Cuscuta australis]|uniref:Uncharacterized protein n=1 Tax=Cuscuta australis TaxID=267555 RepID=A0A328DJC4_9ASTE|nr:hypothetical protein DM860_016419 [Cuscuta australis]
MAGNQKLVVVFLMMLVVALSPCNHIVGVSADPDVFGGPARIPGIHAVQKDSDVFGGDGAKRVKAHIQTSLVAKPNKDEGNLLAPAPAPKLPRSLGALGNN